MNPDLKNGDVVWKKWDGFFWPCIYHTLDKLPGGEQLHTRYVAAVEYFGENKYEYLTARTKIHPYNCVDKHLFIKKGVQKQQKEENSDNYMNKFLHDVKLAEARTHGNIKILSLPEFQLRPQKKNCATLIKVCVSNEDSDALSSLPLDKNRCRINVDAPAAAVKHCEDKRRRSTVSKVGEPETPQANEDAAAAAKRIKLHDVRDDDDDSSDEDTVGVSVLNRSSGTRDKNFVVDQIVLVPWRKIYLPGFVTKVIKTKKKDIVYVRYVNGPRHVRAFRKNAKCILDFRDSERNSALREAAAAVEPSSAEAYDRCVQYLSIRSNRIKDLSAFRFLTRHPNDLHYGVIPDSELSISVKDLFLDSQYSEEEEETYNFGEPETSGDDAESEEDIAPTPPCISTLQLSQDERLLTVQEASKLLEVIKTDACLAHLQAISDGKTTSWRHKMYNNGTKKERNELRGSSGLGVFYDEVQSYELLSYLRKNLPRIESVDKSRYMLNVWLPEAMLYAMKEVHKVDQSEAERLLRETSCLSSYIEHLRK